MWNSSFFTSITYTLTPRTSNFIKVKAFWLKQWYISRPCLYWGCREDLHLFLVFVVKFKCKWDSGTTSILSNVHTARGALSGRITSARWVLALSSCCCIRITTLLRSHRYWTKRLKYLPKCVGTFGRHSVEITFSVLYLGTLTRNIKQQGVCTAEKNSTVWHNNTRDPCPGWVLYGLSTTRKSLSH